MGGRDVDGEAVETPTEHLDRPQGAEPTTRSTPGAHRLPQLALAAVMILFVVLGTFIAIETPAYESADEPGHVENIETLVSGHWYGIDSRCGLLPPATKYCTGTEAHQAPLYYLLLAGWQRFAGVPAQPPYHGAVNLRYFGENPAISYITEPATFDSFCG